MLGVMTEQHMSKGDKGGILSVPPECDHCQGVASFDDDSK
jgi:hypothetical protein